MQENKMGVMPVPKLLVSMSLPIIISMLVQAFYNVVDTYFISISFVGETGVTALGYAFSVQNMMIGVATGVGVGMNALVSKSLGEKRPRHASKVAMQGVLIAIISTALFMVIGIFFAEPFMLTQIARVSETDEAVKQQIAEYGTSYLRIVCGLSIGIFMQITFERMLQSTGRTIYTMISQSSGALINIVLDWIMVPKMGVEGAAYATVIGQCIAALMAFLFNHFKNTDYKLVLKYIKPDLKIMGRIMAIGLPSILMMAVGSVMNYLMNNWVFAPYGTDPITVFAYYFKIQSFIFMPVFGLNNGLVPVVAYNYGAGYKQRLYQAIKTAIVCALVLMGIGILLFQTMPRQILEVFQVSESVMQLGISAMRIISISYIFAGFCIVCGSVCQALGKSIYSFFVSIGRQLVALLPSALLLSYIFNDIHKVWWAFPIAEIVSLAMSTFFIIRVLKKLDWNRQKEADDE